ncbi:type I DNA topoisomerase [Aestuariimicrobium sp. T2.26MG-19.2B]|uniref:type I DNA topoisomerase n=1 Tax=Aestuariimicrobium sp. T2.26MG-19.2B TaxID=3040679 RepID=UPI0024779F04|nr:type I DNA topoisomerase [Aestuariimicrobium sp. T2.26MG-19.2B]CAI9404841.1 DNA topoisomerase 1 [Aestuariimicrobium sp. T2.26MG-19.2B]
MSKTLVIVESPTKATKIASYLGDGYIVESSRGHVRDLPQGASEVPAKYKGEKWARTGVDVEHDFEPLYVVQADKKATIRTLKDHLKDADELLLATDGDREGEAIAWHLLQELKPKVPAKRMVFHEITKPAILDAVAHPRELDLDLVDAQETRRILDRLYGFEVSPVLWKKVKPRLSAGRVQSVATRLVVDRERERMAFTSASYWDIDATLVGSGEVADFGSRLVSLDDAKVAQGGDFDSHGRLKSAKAVALDETSATAIATALSGREFVVASVESKPYTRRPYAPFRTTTLQQDAGRRLRMSAEETMRVAQSLYEGGHITYMRTDSTTLSSSAITAARAQAVQLFGPEAIPDRPRVYASKVKNAQEAHEAIRPAGEHFRTPAQTGLTGAQFRLYELIWQRTIASQMVDAQGQTLTVKFEARPETPVAISQSSKPVEVAHFTSSGRTITKPGFLRAYVAGVEEDESSDDAQARLPQLKQGQQVAAREVVPAGHATKPPARYTEPTLVAKLEELEIGRPSTYASILRTITARDYVFKRGSALVPTWLAFAVTRLLEERFAHLVDYQFTADMEGVLDEIARGNAKRLGVLTDFYFGDADGSSSPSGREGLHRLVNELGEIDAREISTFPIGTGQLGEESGIVVRVGKFGTYLEDSEGRRANVDDDLAPDELTVDKARELLATPTGEEREIGVDPQTHTPIVARNGRFGPYVTEVLPEDAPKSAKPRTGSLFASMDLATITLDQALQLMSLPRVVGSDDDGAEITAQNGRYGPYLKKGTDSRSLTSEEQIFSIGLDEAKQIFAAPKTRGRAAARGPLKELGADPVSGKPVEVKDGRFGPYVTDGEFNATLRKDDSVEEITLERAAELLAEKRAKGPAPKRTTTRRATTTKKAPARKAPAKKAPAKTTAAKTTAARTTATGTTGAKRTTTRSASQG